MGQPVARAEAVRAGSLQRSAARVVERGMAGERVEPQAASSQAAPIEPEIVFETRGEAGLITLRRPKALNALNSALINDLSHAMASLDADPAVSALVLTGSEKAFAAGEQFDAEVGARACKMPRAMNVSCRCRMLICLRMSSARRKR